MWLCLNYGVILDCQTDFAQILANINQDLFLNLDSKDPKKTSLVPLNINFTIGNDYSYWFDFGEKEQITKTLDHYGVTALLSYETTTKQGKSFTITATPDNPIFGFQISENCHKVYRPLESKNQYKHVWLGAKPAYYKDIFGIQQLPDYSEIILIVEGLKDCVVSNANGFTAVGIDNANTKIDSNTVQLLQSKCKHLIVCLDNDETGCTASSVLSKLHQLHKLQLPKKHGKDISDFFHQSDGSKNQEFTQLIRSAVEKPLLELDEPKNDFEKILRSKTFLQQQITQTVTFANPIISQNENGIIHPNTINVIQGKAGVHKSRLVENLCSCLLTSDSSINFLGYKKQLTSFSNYSVLYVDTERNLKDQYIYALQQIKIKAGFTIEDELPNFDFISLIDVARNKRFDVLKQYLEYIRKKFDNHVFIVLDVITDCVSNFNDVSESLKLIDLLNVMINKYNVTFLCVIHENPTDGHGKARGHLGTEILNKASCQMQIGFEKDRNHQDTDLLKVSYLKVRVGKKPDPFFLQYCDKAKGLILADFLTVKESLDSKKSKADLNSIKKRLTTLLVQPMERQLLNNTLMIEFECGQRTIVERIKSLLDDNETILNGNNQDCNLTKETTNRKVYYSLEPITKTIQLIADEMPF